MWQADIDHVNGKTHHYRLRDRSGALSYQAVIDLWQNSSAFREFFNEVLGDSVFHAFRWETPPVTSTTSDREFEFVLLKADGLDRPVDRSAFASYFDSPVENQVVSFTNLGGDATLIVPGPASDDSAHGHLAAFARRGPSEQVGRLWQEIGHAMSERIGVEPVWCSTAGMGVSWLHVRLDSRPKYYGHGPYRESGRSSSAVKRWLNFGR